MADTRPDCGGIYGSATFGQRSYAAHEQCVSLTRPDCGGIYGTGTFGQRYYAGHYQCVPLKRPDCGGIWGTGAWGMRYYAGHKQCEYVPPVPPVPPPYSNNKGRRKPFKKEQDLDEFVLIIGLWNLIPRPSASPLPKVERGA